QSIKVDVRVLAATRRDLDHEVQVGRFRDDLFHRIAVGRIALPPLRARRGDIAVLASAFWAELGGRGEIPTEALRRWEDDPWPGNVRALRNAVARSIAVGDLVPVEEPRPNTSAPPAPLPPRAAEATEPDPIAAVIAERLPFTVARMHVI